MGGGALSDGIRPRAAKITSLSRSLPSGAPEVAMTEGDVGERTTWVWLLDGGTEEG